MQRYLVLVKCAQCEQHCVIPDIKIALCLLQRFMKKAPATPDAARASASASASPASAARPPRRLDFPYHQLFSPPPAHKRCGPVTRVAGHHDMRVVIYLSLLLYRVYLAGMRRLSILHSLRLLSVFHFHCCCC